MTIQFRNGACTLLALSLTLSALVACSAAGPSGSSSAKDDVVEYAAVAYATATADRIVLMQANYTDNTCWRIQLNSIALTPSKGLTSINVPDPWVLSQVTTTDDATSCLDGSIPPPGTPTTALIGTGDITWELRNSMFYPCELDIDASLALDKLPPSQLQKNTKLLAESVEVIGGCL